MNAGSQNSQNSFLNFVKYEATWTLPNLKAKAVFPWSGPKATCTPELWSPLYQFSFHVGLIRFGHPIIFFLPTNSLFYFEAHSIFPLSYLDNWLFLALPCSLNLGLPLLSQATFSGLPIGILHLGSFQVSNIWWVQYNKIRLSTLNFRDIKMYSLQCPNVQFY